MKSFLDKINDHIKALDNETQSALQTISSTKQYNTGEFLLRQTEVCSKS
jgi:hypothetical protein